MLLPPSRVCVDVLRACVWARVFLKYATSRDDGRIYLPHGGVAGSTHPLRAASSGYKQGIVNVSLACP